MPADPETLAAVDKLFNAWLALNNILSSGGYLYQADKAGKILNDAQGKPIKVKPEQFNVLMADPQKGFQAFAASKGLRITPVQRQFPENG